MYPQWRESSRQSGSCPQFMKSVLVLKMPPKANTHPTPRLLTLKAAAEYLGLKVSSLRTRIWAGDIPIVRFKGGKKIFVDRQDLEALIQRNKETYI